MSLHGERRASVSATSAAPRLSTFRERCHAGLRVRTSREHPLCGVRDIGAAWRSTGAARSRDDAPATGSRGLWAAHLSRSSARPAGGGALRRLRAPAPGTRRTSGRAVWDLRVSRPRHPAAAPPRPRRTGRGVGCSATLSSACAARRRGGASSAGAPARRRRPVVMLPSTDPPRFPMRIPAPNPSPARMPRRRVRRLRIHVRAMAREALGQAAVDASLAAALWEPPRAPADVPDAAVAAPFLGGACAVCGGRCCRHGGERAYLTADTLRRWFAAHPDLQPRAAVAAYVAHLPETSLRDSCVYHTAHGCALPRAMRSDESAPF